MVTQTFDKFESTFSSFSSTEATNWNQWKKMMLKDVEAIKPEGPPRLSARLRKGVKDLKELNLVLKHADKNLGLVAIRGDIYNHMVREHLDSDSFQKVPVFPQGVIIKRLENIVKIKTPEIALSVKNGWIAKAMEAKEPCPFYIIPKIHKPRISSRPITAQHSYMLSTVSKALTQVLQPISDQLDEIARDSKMVVQQLETREVPEDCVFLTYDIEKMYPTIDLRDAIATLEQHLPVMRSNNGFWKRILQLIMYNNYVTWNEEIYRQQKGTATGTQVAPPFANLYTYFKFKPIFDEEASGIYFNSRLIDDGLLIVQDAVTARRIIGKLNQASSMNLTYVISNNMATFLDLDIYKGPRFKAHKIVDIKVHFKSTNKLLYLPANSNHPGIHKASVVKGEAIRCLRNTSDKIEWLKALHFIFKGMMARGYDGRLIKRKWKEVRFEDREKYVFENSTPMEPKPSRIFVPFHSQAKKRWKVMLKRWPVEPLLIAKRSGKLNQEQKKFLEEWPPQVIFKDFRKIGRMVVNAKEVGISPLQ